MSIYDGFKFKVISKKDGLVHNEITKLFSKGNLMYVGTSDGVSIIDINSFKVHSLNDPARNALLRVRNFFEYGEQIYVATYRSGLYKIVSRQNEMALEKINDRTFIYSVFVDNDSIYSSNKGFYSKISLDDYVKENEIVSEKRHGSSIIWDHVKTEDEKIFVAAWGIYDANGGIYELLDEHMISRAAQFKLPSKEVVSLAYDPKFKKLYAGTQDAGLFEIALDPQVKFHELEGDVLGFARTKNSSAAIIK